MPVRSVRRAYLLGSSALLAVIGFSDAAIAQFKLPEVEVTSTRAKPKPRPAAVARPTAPAVAPPSPAEQLAAKTNAFDQSRSNLYTTIGTTSSTQTHATIDALPQGINQTVEKVLLQAPGVSQDSVASGFLHVRNDHGNVQYRINGVILPDGIGGFGSVLSTSENSCRQNQNRDKGARIHPGPSQRVSNQSNSGLILNGRCNKCPFTNSRHRPLHHGRNLPDLRHQLIKLIWIQRLHAV